MAFFYSPKNNGFYCDEFKSSYEEAGSWPDDAIEIDTQIYDKYKSSPPEGKILGSDENGMPTWISIPDTKTSQ